MFPIIWNEFQQQRLSPHVFISCVFTPSLKISARETLLKIYKNILLTERHKHIIATSLMPICHKQFLHLFVHHDRQLMFSVGKYRTCKKKNTKPHSNMTNVCNKIQTNRIYDVIIIVCVCMNIRRSIVYKIKCF